MDAQNEARLKNLRAKAVDAANAFKNLQDTVDYVANMDNDKDENPTRVLRMNRMLLVKAFEMCTETLWKFVRIILIEENFLEVASSPRGVMHQALKAGVLSADETNGILEMITNRNIMSHCYDNDEAFALEAKIPEYAIFIGPIVKKLLERT